MMWTMKKMTGFALGLFTLVGGIQSSAKGQIAYIPEVGFVPTGVTMTVTPAVSADRRYVRLSVNTFFNDVIGFSTFSFPGGAVSGGQNFGGAGAGVNAGMNGIIGDDGYQSGVQVGTRANGAMTANQSGDLRAGPLPGGGAPGVGDPMFFEAGMNQGDGFGMMPGLENEEAALRFAMENGPRRGARAAAGAPARSPRRALHRKTTKTKPTRKASSAQSKSR
jgi:hypothetical protein